MHSLTTLISCLIYLIAFIFYANAYPSLSDALVIDLKEPTVSDIIAGDKFSAGNRTGNYDGNLIEDRILYTGSQLWQVVLDDDEKKIVVGKLRASDEISTWGGNLTSIDIMVRPKYQNKVARTLTASGISYEIVINDIQSAIDNENPEPSEDEEELANRKGRKLLPASTFPLRHRWAWKGMSDLGPSKEYWPIANWGHRMTWSAYHRLEDIHSYLDYLATTYPELCSVQRIGTSVQGRPIQLLKISNGNASNGGVWIDGGVHAREWISPATVTYILNQFVENFDTESEDVRNLDWYFVPIVNPDGYEYSHTKDRLWRKNRSNRGNCAGTDLNRNFGYKWGGKGSSKNPCTEIYGGTGPFSEPETVAIRDFITSSGTNLKMYLSFHSYGQYILYPWGYDRFVPPDHQDLKNVAQKAAQAIRQISGVSYKIGPAANTLYPASGGSDDWAKGSAKIKYAYTVELRDTGRHGFILPASYIDPTAKEALTAVRVFAAAARLA